jgi:hypothetical protein
VIADKHGLAGLKAGRDAASSVGEHDGLAACGHGGAHAVHDGGGGVALVQVGAAEEDEHVQAADPDRPHDGQVAWHGGGGQLADIGERDLAVGGPDRVGCRCPAGAEYHGDVVARLSSCCCEPLRAGCRGGVGICHTGRI